MTMQHRSPTTASSAKQNRTLEQSDGPLAWLPWRREAAEERKQRDAEAAEAAERLRTLAVQQEERFFQRFKTEVRIMTTLRHRYITRFYGCSLHMQHFYILMELCDCSLRHAIDRYRQHCPAPLKQQLGGQRSSITSRDSERGRVGSSALRGGQLLGVRTWRMPLEVALEYARQVAVALCHLERKVRW